MYNIAVHRLINCGFAYSSCVIDVDLVLPKYTVNTTVTNEIPDQCKPLSVIVRQCRECYECWHVRQHAGDRKWHAVEMTKNALNFCDFSNNSRNCSGSR